MVALTTALILASAAQTGAGIYGSAQARNAQQNALQAQIAEQRRADFLNRIRADRALDIQLEGGTNAAGDTTRYIPGRGFVTTPSPSTAAGISASRGEERLRNTQDAARNRDIAEQTFSTRLDDLQDAGGLRETFRRRGSTGSLPTQARAQERNIATRGVNATSDQTENAVLTQLMRSGQRVQPALASFTGPRRDAIASAISGADARAANTTATQDDQRTLIANLLNQFLARGTRAPTDTYTPTNVDRSADAALSGAQGRAASIVPAILASGATRAVNIPVDPTAGLLATGVGSSIGGTIEQIAAIEAQQARDAKTNALLERFLQNQGASPSGAG